MFYKIITLDNSQEWDCLLQKIPINQQDIYFTAEYYSLYENLGDGKATCFVFEYDKTIILYPFLKNSINQLGFKLDKEYFDIQGAYGYNGIIPEIENPIISKLFRECFEKYCSESNIVTEFTRFHPLFKNHYSHLGEINISFDRETVVIDLQNSYNKIWVEQYTSQCRNMIRKSQKLGHKSQIILTPNTNQINEFIDIYRQNMNKVNADKYYYFNENLFYNIFKCLKQHALMINIINHKNILICSSIFFHYKNNFHYHLSARSEYADNSANIYLIDIAVKYAKEIGANLFHLGGGRTCENNDSLLLFKKNFSKTKAIFYIGKRVHNEVIYNETIRQWEEMFPEKKDKFRNHILKYRF